MVNVLSDNTPPPFELRMAWQCQRWHCLPDSGGLYEQDYKLLRRMASLSNIYDSISRWRNLTGERIHHLSDHDRRILRFLLDNGINFNA